VLVKPHPEVEEILQKALEGQRILPEEALRLLRSEKDDLLAVALTANRIREAQVGETVTYVINRNINFTNVCVGSCRFCGFRKGPEDPDRYLIDRETFRRKVREALEIGATEICLQGGLNPALDLSYYLDLLEMIREEGDLHIHAFSPMEIAFLAEREGSGFGEILRSLKGAGLDSMPGTAAEILEDGVRKVICPEKIDSETWVEIVRSAHRLGIPSTATMLYGHIEGPEEQVEHLRVLRSPQDETGGFTEFVPLAYIHYNTPLYLSGGSKEGSTGLEDLRLFTTARIFLDNIQNLQASWVKLGRKFAQVMLQFGANDLGGTLMEENISRSAGLRSEMLSPMELERMIREAGRTPRQRDTLYRLLRPLQPI